MHALMHVKEVELMGMPKLKKCVLMGGLKNVKSVKMENAGKLESVKGLKEVMEEEKKRREEEEEESDEARRACFNEKVRVHFLLEICALLAGYEEFVRRCACGG